MFVMHVPRYDDYGRLSGICNLSVIKMHESNPGSYLEANCSTMRNSLKITETSLDRLSS